MSQKQYVFIIDKESHERKATLLVGPHGKTLEAVMHKAETEYPDDLRVPSKGEDLYNELVGKNKLYIDGKCVERQPYVPTQEEMAAAAKSEKLATLQKLLDDTDYKAIKYAEGVITAEEFAPTKAKRQAWREAYNAIEAAGTVEEVNSITWPEA